MALPTGRGVREASAFSVRRRGQWRWRGRYRRWDQPLQQGVADLGGEGHLEAFVAQMQIPLGEGHCHVVMAKDGFDAEVELTADLVLTPGLVDPDQQQKIQGTLPEALEEHLGWWRCQDVGQVLAGLQQGLTHHRAIGAVGHAHRNLEAGH